MAAVERHQREISELKRFWNLLLRGMEVKTWKTIAEANQVEPEEENTGISEDVLALGNSLLTMMDTSSQDGKCNNSSAEDNTPKKSNSQIQVNEGDVDEEEAYSVLWLLSSDPILCVDKQKTFCAAHRTEDCLLFPLAQLQDPVAVDVSDPRFFGILLCSSTNRLVVGLPTERCRCLMLEHLARVMAAFAALDQKDSERQDLSFSANMEVALFACNPMAHQGQCSQEPEQEPTIGPASKTMLNSICVLNTCGRVNSSQLLREQAQKDVRLILLGSEQ